MISQIVLVKNILIMKVKPDPILNGCARGKFLLDQHLGMWKEGIKEELFSKKEFLSRNNFSLELCEFINKGLYQ